VMAPGPSVIERPDRHLTTDRGVKPGPPPTATCRRNLHVAEHSIDRRGADGEQLRLLVFAELQATVLLQCRHKGRDHHHEPLAAHSSRRKSLSRKRPCRFFEKVE
jgi:hypothetical protein